MLAAPWSRLEVPELLRCAVVYAALVFGAGFLLGPPRVLWLVPRVGVRAAELIEMPFMVLVIVGAARFVVRRFPAVPRSRHVPSGLLALALMLVAEFGLAWSLTGATPSEQLQRRDPVSGTVYAGLLVVFALTPWLVARRGG